MVPPPFRVLVAAAALAAGAAVPAHAAKLEQVRSVEGITEYKLDNGLQLLLVPDPTQATVTVNVTYLVGSRHEGYGETGMAHLLEHMMFKGTPTHRNVLKLVQERGGWLNGTTWNDRTNYFETMPAGDNNLAWALTLEADRMRHASISKEDLSTEFSVVRNEFEMGENNPTAILEERMVSTAYLWHNYGKSTIGSRADIERVKTESLRAFYDKYYQPDNAVLVIAGKFDDKLALGLVQKTFGAIKRPGRALASTYTTEPVQDGERSVILRRNGDVTVTGVLYHTVGAADLRFAAVNAAVDLLTHEGSGRLYKSLIETKLAARLDGHQYAFRDPNVAVLMATVRDPANLDKVEAALTSTIEGMGASTIEPAEVERWRNAELKEIDLQLTRSTNVGIILSEYAALGDWRTLFVYRDRVKDITPADVQKAAKDFFRSSNRTSGRFVPTKDADRAPLVESPDPAVAVASLGSGKELDRGEEFAANYDNVEKRTVRGALPGGMKTAFLPKKTRGGRVLLRLDLHYGDEQGLQGKQIAGEMAVAMLSRGTTSRTYQQLEDQKDKLKARINISGDVDGLTVTIDTLKEQLPAAIDLAAEMLTKPSFPAAELEIVRQKTLASLEEELQDPSSVAFNVLLRTTQPWPKGDPREILALPDHVAGVKQVGLPELQAFYRDFIGADHGELAVVGDFDPAAIGGQVDKLLGGWKTKKPYARLQRKVFDVKAKNETVDTRDKEMAQLTAAHDVAIRTDDPDYPAWMMAGRILGGDPGSRIWMRLREKEGLSYGAWGWTYADDEDAAGGLNAGAIVAPQNLAKAKTSLLEEVKRIATGNVTPAELTRAKDGWVKSEDTQLSNDNIVASKLTRSLHLNRTFAWDIEQREKVKALTPADIARVARKHIDPSKLVVVEAGDMTKAK